VSNHFGEFTGIRECPGVPVGLRVRLDNGLMGFVGMRNISDQSEKITDPTKLFKVNKIIIFFHFLNFSPAKTNIFASLSSSQIV